jgi:hypothetical protein
MQAKRTASERNDRRESEAAGSARLVGIELTAIFFQILASNGKTGVDDPVDPRFNSARRT